MLGAEDHPLLAEREGGKRLIVLVTTDRGLAGPLNTNTIRFASREILDHPGDLAVVTVGRKGRDAMRRAGVPLEAHFAGFGDRRPFGDVAAPGPPHHRGLPGRQRTTASTSSTAAS